MTTTLEPAAPKRESAAARRHRQRAALWGKVLGPPRWVRRQYRRLTAWAWRRWAPPHMPAPYRTRRLASPRMAVAWAITLTTLVLSLWAFDRASTRDDFPTYTETDRGAAAALWAAGAWRDSAALGRTPTPIGWDLEPGGYWRVTLDRNSPAGCVQLGVLDRPAGFLLAGDPAPVACPPPRAGTVIAGPELFNGDLRSFAIRFVGDYLGGRDLSLYAAPGVVLRGPVAASEVKVDHVWGRENTKGQSDVTVDVVADQGAGRTRFGVRLTISDRDGKLEVVEVRGGAFADDTSVRDLPIPPATAPTATTTATAGKASNAGPITTTTARPAAATTTAPPAVTLAPSATTTPSSAPPPPANAGA